MEVDDDTTLIDQNNNNMSSSPLRDYGTQQIHQVDQITMQCPAKRQREVAQSDQITIERPAKRQRRVAPKQEKYARSSYTRLQGVTDDLNDDLIDFGFSPTTVKTMVAQQQPIWDPWKRESLEFDQQADILADRKRQESRKRRAIEKSHIPLYLKKDSPWMIFDPDVHSFPTHIGTDAPAIFRRLERFEAGNKRIVEIHDVSGSVRIRSAPKELIGKRIDYGRTGPKIADPSTTNSKTMNDVAKSKDTSGITMESMITKDNQVKAKVSDGMSVMSRATDDTAASLKVADVGTSRLVNLTDCSTAASKVTDDATSRLKITNYSTIDSKSPEDGKPFSNTASNYNVRSAQVKTSISPQPPPPPVKRKPGRPKKNPEAEATKAAEDVKVQADSGSTAMRGDTPKKTSISSLWSNAVGTRRSERMLTRKRRRESASSEQNEIESSGGSKTPSV